MPSVLTGGSLGNASLGHIQTVEYGGAPYETKFIEALKRVEIGC